MEHKKILVIDNQEIREMRFSDNCLYVISSDGLQDHLYCFFLKSKELKKIEMPIDIIEQFELHESGILYLLGRDSVTPFNIFKKNRMDDNWSIITNNFPSGLRSKELVIPEVLKYSSYDGEIIHSLFYRANENNRNEHTILWVHGGPQAAERKKYRPLFQYLLSNGYNIFAPNYRGSKGFGKRFMSLVEGDWGGGPRLDIVEGIDWIIRENYAEMGKIIVMGSSYGGYMSLLLTGRHSEYFKGCIDMFGPTNLFTFVKRMPDQWKAISKKWIGDPEIEKEKFVSHSPITYIDNINIPVMIVQGENDKRVNYKESQDIVNKLKSKNRDVTYILLSNEGHGITIKENEIMVIENMINFLKKISS